LLDRFDPYVVCLYLLEKKEIRIIAIDVHLTSALLVGGCNVVEVGNECSHDDFELGVHDLRAYWNLEGAPLLSEMTDFIL